MPSEVCIDANVIISFISPDECSSGHDLLMKKTMLDQLSIYVPALLVFEVLSVLSRKEKSKLIKHDEAAQVLENFYSLPLLQVWNLEMLKIAHQLVSQGLPSSYDATYLALAKLKQIPLITEDKELQKKGRKLYPKIYSIDEYLA